jgi:branched-subunit amino acid aminotransferase/4-amino-4-deoxychorismate lyase
MAEAWLNGRFLRADEPGLSLAERGFLLGEAAFETMRVVDGAKSAAGRAMPARLRGGLGFLGSARARS